MSARKTVRKSIRSAATIFALVLWIILVVAGFVGLAKYENRPGKLADAPEIWPERSSVKRSGEKPVLMVFAHPQCPCTRATIGELARVMRYGHEKVDAYVLFLQPAGFDDPWTESDLWTKARAIPGVTVLKDLDGQERVRFRAYTSGQVLLYDQNGSLQFSGGITASRGHEGLNDGSKTLIALFRDDKPGRTKNDVYGCSLGENNAGCTEERCTI